MKKKSKSKRQSKKGTSKRVSTKKAAAKRKGQRAKGVERRAKKKASTKTAAKKASTKTKRVSRKKTAKKTTDKAIAAKKVAKKKITPKRAPTKKPARAPKTMEPRKTSSKLRGKEPKTMDELLEQTGYELRGIKRGELVEGTVTDVSKKMVLVDIGGKTEGLVVDKEYEAAAEFIAELSVGDTLIVYVLTPENERGQILLSLKKAAADRTWEKFEEAHKTGEVMSVRGLEVNRGGVIVRADSVQGFVPASQFGKLWLGKMDELMNRSFKVQVIEVDREKNRLIFSEKQVSEADEIKQRKKALKKIKVGEEYEGVVSGIMPFGVFVSVDVPLGQSTGKSTPKGGQAKVKSSKLKVHAKGRAGKDQKTAKEQKESGVGKVEGLVHISEISWEKVDDPNSYFKVGATVKVKILGIDETSGKLNLSVKQLTPDPWEKIEKKYPSGKKVKGKVTRVAPFGAFVTLEPGIEGLLHISKIPAGEEPEVGKDISIFVEQVDSEHRRMSLGMVLKEVPVGYK
jgi:predicted RNA-binding protein with RPS1 domain